MKILSFLIATVLSVTVFAGGPKPGSGRNRGKTEVAKSTVREAAKEQSATLSKELGEAVPGLKVSLGAPEKATEAEVESYMAREAEFVSRVKDATVDLIANKTKAADVASLTNQYMGVLSVRHKFTEDAELTELIDQGFKHISTRVLDTAENPTSTSQLSKMFEALGSAKKAKLDAEDFSKIKDAIKSIFGGDFTLRQIIDCTL